MIGTCAFWGCSALAHASLPTTLTAISSQAFYDAPSLVEITLPNGLQTIDRRACGESGLVSVTLPESVTQRGGQRL